MKNKEYFSKEYCPSYIQRQSVCIDCGCRVGYRQLIAIDFNI